MASDEEMGETAQLLLTLLEWQDRTDRWLAFPEPARQELVKELARLSTEVAVGEADDERRGEDQRPPP